MSDNALEFADNAIAKFGSSGDLQLFHNGTNSHIHSATGELDIRSDDFHLRNAANNENMIVADANGAVQLYHDNSKKFETTSTGATVTGNLTVSGVLTYDDVTNIDSVGIVTARSGTVSYTHLTLPTKA